MITKEQIVEKLGLSPLKGEGGMHRQIYLADEQINGRSICSVIYYLLDEHSFSHMHRLTADENYYFYMGDPVELLMLKPDGSSESVILGQDILNGQHVQYLIKAGTWQGSHLLDGGGRYGYALMGTSMAPAYSDEDYEHGSRELLCRSYPKDAELIKTLTN